MPLNTHKWYWQLILLVLLVLPDPSRAQMKFYNQLDLLEGKKKATIPFRYIHNFIVLDVRLYGILPLKFIFDTGAEHIILFKREYTDILNVEYDKRIPVMGSDLSREIYALITRNAQVEVEGLASKPYDLLILEQDYFNLDEMIGTPIAGLLGGGFFKNLVVNIDYKKSQITLYDPAFFKIPDGYLSLPIRIKLTNPISLQKQACRMALWSRLIYWWIQALGFRCCYIIILILLYIFRISIYGESWGWVLEDIWKAI
jgi:hypothetical protein